MTAYGNSFNFWFIFSRRKKNITFFLYLCTLNINKHFFSVGIFTCWKIAGNETYNHVSSCFIDMESIIKLTTNLTMHCVHKIINIHRAVFKIKQLNTFLIYWILNEKILIYKSSFSHIDNYSPRENSRDILSVKIISF